MSVSKACIEQPRAHSSCGRAAVKHFDPGAHELGAAWKPKLRLRGCREGPEATATADKAAATPPQQLTKSFTAPLRRARPHGVAPPARLDYEDGTLQTEDAAARRVCVTNEERESALQHAHDLVALKTVGVLTPQRTGFCSIRYFAARAPDASHRGFKCARPTAALPLLAHPFLIGSVGPRQLLGSAGGDKWMAGAARRATKSAEATPIRRNHAVKVDKFPPK